MAKEAKPKKQLHKKQDSTSFSEETLRGNGQNDSFLNELIDTYLPISGFRFPTSKEIDPVFGMAASYNGLKEKVFAKILENFGLINDGTLYAGTITNISRQVGQIENRKKFFKDFFEIFNEDATKEDVFRLLDEWSAKEVYQGSGLNPGIFGKNKWFSYLFSKNKGNLTKETIVNYLIDTYIKELDGHNWKEWLDYGSFETDTIPKHIERMHDKNKSLVIKSQFDKHQIKFLNTGKITYTTLFRRNWIDNGKEDSFIEKKVSSQTIFAKKFFNKFKRSWKKIAPCFFLPKENDLNLWMSTPTGVGKKQSIIEILKNVTSTPLDSNSTILLNYVLFGRSYAYKIMDSTDTMNRINKVFRIISSFYSKEKEAFNDKNIDAETYYSFASALVETLKNNEEYIARKEKNIILEKADITSLKNYIKPNAVKVFEDSDSARENLRKIIQYIAKNNGEDIVKKSCYEQIKGNINFLKYEIKKCDEEIEKYKAELEEYELNPYLSISINQKLENTIERKKGFRKKITSYRKFLKNPDSHSTKSVFYQSLSDEDKKTIDEIAEFYYKFLINGRKILNIKKTSTLAKISQSADGINKCLDLPIKGYKSVKDFIKNDESLKTPKDISEWLEKHYDSLYEKNGMGEKKQIYKDVLAGYCKEANQTIKEKSFFKEYTNNKITPFTLLLFNDIENKNSNTYQIIKALKKNGLEENITKKETEEEIKNIIEHRILAINENPDICDSQYANFIKSVGISLDVLKSFSFNNLFSILYNESNIIDIFYSNSSDQFSKDMGVNMNVQYLKQRLHQMCSKLIQLNNGEYDKKDVSYEAVLSDEWQFEEFVHFFKCISLFPEGKKTISDVKNFLNVKISACSEALEELKNKEVTDKSILLNYLNKPNKETISGKVGYIVSIDKEKTMNILKNTKNVLTNFSIIFENYVKENFKENGKPLCDFFLTSEFNSLFNNGYRFEITEKDSIDRSVATENTVAPIFKNVLKTLSNRISQMITREKTSRLRKLANYCNKRNRNFNFENSEEFSEILKQSKKSKDDIRNIMEEFASGRKKQMITTLLECYKDVKQGIENLYTQMKVVKSKILKKYERKLFDFKNFAKIANRYLRTAETMVPILSQIKPIVITSEGAKYPDPLDSDIIAPLLSDTGTLFMDCDFTVNTELFKNSSSRINNVINKYANNFKIDLKQFITSIAALCSNEYNKFKTKSAIKDSLISDEVKFNIQNIKNKIYEDGQFTLSGGDVIKDLSDWEIVFNPGSLSLGQSEKLKGKHIDKYINTIFNLINKSAQSITPKFTVTYTFNVNQIKRRIRKEREEYQTGRKRKVRDIDDFQEDLSKALYNSSKDENDNKIVSKIINEMMNDLLYPILQNNIFVEHKVNFDIVDDNDIYSFGHSDVADIEVKRILDKMETEDNLKDSKKILNGLRTKGINGFKLHKDMKNIDALAKRYAEKDLEASQIYHTELDKIQKDFENQAELDRAEEEKDELSNVVDRYTRKETQH